MERLLIQKGQSSDQLTCVSKQMGVSRRARRSKLVLVGFMVLFVLLSSQWTEVGLLEGCTEGGNFRLVVSTQRDCVINENCNVWVINET